VQRPLDCPSRLAILSPRISSGIGLNFGIPVGSNAFDIRKFLQLIDACSEKIARDVSGSEQGAT
jgi:dsDNA-specific endonuclease/ATPase MutS2